MSKLRISLALLAFSAFTAAAFAQQTLVYDNSTTNTFYWSPWDWPQGNYSFPYEHGDHMVLAGTQRAVSQIDILYTNPLSNSVTTDIIVRLYNGDPTVGAAQIWTTTLPAVLFPNNQPKTISVTVPNVALSGNDCTVTYQFTNIQGSPVGVGLQSFYPPTVGTSENWFPAKVNGVWAHYTYGNQTLANFALRIFANPAATPCPGDVDGDRDVDLNDLALALANYGCVSNCAGDVDGDGDVDLGDLAALLANYGAVCP